MRSRSSIPATLFFLGASIAFLGLTGCSSQGDASPTASIGDSRYSSPDDPAAPAKPRFNLHPVVEIETTAGKFTLQLDGERAPLTVDNFLGYVESGGYDGTIFHQAFDGYIVLGGGYDSRFTERPTRPAVRNEAHNGLKNRRGSVAMARQADAVDSATSQFFINLADNESLDHAGTQPSQYGYCVFGEVTEGMDVIEKIAGGEVHNTKDFVNVPASPVVIQSIRRVK